MKAFSFCLYGQKNKYCRGLLVNLELIHIHYPDFHVFVALGNDVPENIVQQIKEHSQVHLEEYDFTGARLTNYRFFPIDNPEVEVCFVRDADSRINARDRWCIDQFLVSAKKFHIIRDQYLHKTRIPGGLWGCKSGLLTEKVSALYEEYSVNNDVDKYGNNQDFLQIMIYPRIKHDVLLHTNINRYQDEVATSIDFKNDGTNFVSNVMLFDDSGQEYPEFTYWNFDLHQQLRWLREQQAWDLMVKIYEEIRFSSHPLCHILDEFYIAFFNQGLYEECQDILARFEFTNINEHVIANSNYLFPLLGKKVIGTTDPKREPAEDEIVVVYGNYLWSYDCLPHGNKVYRHSKYYQDIAHDDFEFDPAWNSVEVIYILNLEERVDRFMEIIVELAAMRAPLHRIYHYKAQKESVTGNREQDAHIGAQKNHLDVVNHFIAQGYEHGIIFEDDFTFTSRRSEHLADLKEFFSRNYDYCVGLVGSSQYHRYDAYDDLCYRSYQVCTTTSGYLLNKKSAPVIQRVFTEGHQKLVEGGNPNIYACDRYWAALQQDHLFLLFKRKFGYQRVNYSNITGKVDCHFD